MNFLKRTVLTVLCAILLCAAVSCGGKQQEPDPEMTTHAAATDAVPVTDIGTGESTGESPAQTSVSYPEDGPFWSKDY